MNYDILIHSKVNISHNQIEQINNGAFKFCENMTVLDLSHNKIRRLAPDTFDKNSYSTELKLNDNQVNTYLHLIRNTVLCQN